MQYQKEEVRNRIMEAAFSEFEKSGYYRASMLQISTKAKVPIGNLYRYFKGKEVLFASCVETAYSCSLKLVNSVFDVWLETKDYEATIPTLLAEAKSLGRGLKLLTEKSSGSAYSDFINKIVEIGYNRLSEAFRLNGYEADEFIVRTIAANITEGVISVLIHAPEQRREALLAELMNFYFKDLGERVGGKG